MDLTILWVLLGVVGGIGLVFAVGILLKKVFHLGKEDIMEGIDVAEFAINFIGLLLQDMFKDNPTTEDKIEEIMELVMSTLDFIGDQLVLDPQADMSVLIAEAELFAKEMTESMGLQLTPSELALVNMVVRLTYKALAALPEN